MTYPANAARHLKERLASGKICLGAGVTFADPCVSELMAGAGFDYLVLDSEHGPLDRSQLQAHIIALSGTGTTPLVRVQWSYPRWISQALDMGAGGVIVPMVRTADDIREAVSAAWYPPLGTRGFGPRRAGDYGRHFSDYAVQSKDDAVIIAQIETAEAIENIDEICAVPGLTGAYVGPYDLSGSLGILGELRHPRLIEAAEKVSAAAKRAGIRAGYAGPGTPQQTREWISKGMQFFTLGDDVSFLTKITGEVVNGIREIAPE